MANPLPNEKELYEQIRREKIKVTPDIWDLLYNRIGDDVTAINLLCQYYLKNNEPVPIQEAKKILTYTRHIKDIINQVTVISKDNFLFPEFLDDIPLHSIIREMFTHYIGNDIYMINLIVQDTIDPLDPKPLSLEQTQKILSHTRTIRDFMERLRVATSTEEILAKAKEPYANNKALSREQILLKIRKCLTQEFKFSNEEKVQPHSRFREDLCLDSIDGIRVIMALEDEFGFELPDDAADGILTVSQAVDYISKRLKESP